MKTVKDIEKALEHLHNGDRVDTVILVYLEKLNEEMNGVMNGREITIENAKELIALAKEKGII